jgi:hypothetical protein
MVGDKINKGKAKFHRNNGLLSLQLRLELGLRLRLTIIIILQTGY